LNLGSNQTTGNGSILPLAGRSGAGPPPRTGGRTGRYRNHHLSLDTAEEATCRKTQAVCHKKPFTRRRLRTAAGMEIQPRLGKRRTLPPPDVTIQATGMIIFLKIKIVK